MNSSPNPKFLIEDLCDPFAMFPVESVSDTLLRAVERAEQSKLSLGDIWAPSSRKFWTVEQEHYHEEIGLLVGATFVLGQAAIAQTVSSLKRLRQLNANFLSVIPQSKARILHLHATTDVVTNLAKTTIIDAVSNFFKHVAEWPERWDTVPGSGNQAETIQIALRIGMEPGNVTDNLLRASALLNLNSNPRAIGSAIQEWREAWARELNRHLGS